MKQFICGTSTRRSRHCNGGYHASGRRRPAGNASLPIPGSGGVVCYGKPPIPHCYWDSQPTVKKIFGGRWLPLTRLAGRWWRCLSDGPTSVRYRTRHCAPCRRQGFSLAECLIALLILSLSVLLLSGYHQQLVYGFRVRQAQRDAGWAATQVLAGKPPAGWDSELQRKMTEDGCLRITAKVQGPFNRHAELEQLFCPPFNQHLPQ